MVAQPLSGSRVTTPGDWIILLIASVLVFLVGIQLFILTQFTEQFFAWTIKAPAHGGVSGGRRLGELRMELAASRRRAWVDARIAIPAVLSSPPSRSSSP